MAATPPLPPSSEEERRHYYRIDDNALLTYRVIPPDQVEAVLTRFHIGGADHFSLSASYAGNDTAMTEALARVRSEYPTVAIYLEALERKMNLLAHMVMTMHDPFSEYPTRSLNLSGGGAAFDVEQEIPIDSIVEMKLVLLPKYNGVLAYGTVVHCQHHEEQDQRDTALPWRIAVNFSHIRERDREIITRHILHQQAAWLRKRRFGE